MKNETTSAKIPLLKADLPPFDTICERFRQVYESGWFSNFGKYVTQFEEEASAYLGTHAVTVSSGTQGLVFGLQALGLKPGQKVVLPSFSFMATAQAVIYAGGTPVFIDIESDLTLSPSKLEDLLSMHEDVGAVMPVHIFGLPCRVDEIAEVVKRFSHKRGEAPIPILYDAAHAFGSVYKGMRVGNFGNAEVFSLSTTKILTTIEGGLISTSNAQVAEKIKKMRNYGMAPYSYNASSAGLNGKMSEFHASIGLENIRRVDEILKERRTKAAYFRAEIQEKTNFQTILTPTNVVDNYKYLAVFVPQHLADKRDAIVQFLGDQEIETRTYFYPPIHQQQFFKPFTLGSLPKTENLSRRVITLPFFTSMTEQEMDYVVAKLSEAERVLT